MAGKQSKDALERAATDSSALPTEEQKRQMAEAVKAAQKAVRPILEQQRQAAKAAEKTIRPFLEQQRQAAKATEEAIRPFLEQQRQATKAAEKAVRPILEQPFGPDLFIPERRARRVAGVAVSGAGRDQTTIVACDDGSVWELSGGHWLALRPIPGTDADQEDTSSPAPRRSAE